MLCEGSILGRERKVSGSLPVPVPLYLSHHTRTRGPLPLLTGSTVVQIPLPRTLSSGTRVPSGRRPHCPTGSSPPPAPSPRSPSASSQPSIWSRACDCGDPSMHRPGSSGPSSCPLLVSVADTAASPHGSFDPAVSSPALCCHRAGPRAAGSPCPAGPAGVCRGRTYPGGCHAWALSSDLLWAPAVRCPASHRSDFGQREEFSFPNCKFQGAEDVARRDRPRLRTGAPGPRPCPLSRGGP